MKRIALVAAAILITAPALAQDHLMPERSLYAGTEHLTPSSDIRLEDVTYDFLIVSTLHAAFESDVLVRMVMTGSNLITEPEYAVGVRGTTDHYRIFMLRPTLLLWTHQGLKTRIPVRSCEKDITSERAFRLSSLWEKMLLDTRYPVYKDEWSLIGGSDGETAHFSGGGFRIHGMSGQIHDIEPGTRPELLFRIGSTLKDICESKGAADFGKLDDLIAQLELKFPN